MLTFNITGQIVSPEILWQTEFQVKLSGAYNIFAQCSPLVIFLNLLLQHLHLSRAVVHLASDMKLRKTITFMSLSLHLGFSLLPCRDLSVQLDAGVLTPKEQHQIHIQVIHMVQEQNHKCRNDQSR